MLTLQNNKAETVKQYVITLGSKVKVQEDKKSKSRVVNFPFEFTDGTHGVLIVVRVKDEEWKPHQDINNIHINFNG